MGDFGPATAQCGRPGDLLGRLCGGTIDAHAQSSRRSAKDLLCTINFNARFLAEHLAKPSLF